MCKFFYLCFTFYHHNAACDVRFYLIKLPVLLKYGVHLYIFGTKSFLFTLAVS